MANCTHCGAPLSEGASFCTNCGAAVAAAASSTENTSGTAKPEGAYSAYKDPFDHTSEYSPAEVADGKLYALAVYLFGPFGKIIALLGAKENRYAMYHLRQSLKFAILYAMLGIIAGVLCFTVIIPAVAGIAALVLIVIECISVIQVFGGQAKEPAIVRSFDFLN